MAEQWRQRRFFVLFHDDSEIGDDPAKPDAFFDHVVVDGGERDPFSADVAEDVVSLDLDAQWTND